MEVADAHSFAESDFARVRVLFAPEDGEQSRLAGAVGADESNAVPVVDGEAYVFKQGYGAEAFGDALCIQDRRHSFSLRGRAGLLRRS